MLGGALGFTLSAFSFLGLTFFICSGFRNDFGAYELGGLTPLAWEILQESGQLPLRVVRMAALGSSFGLVL